MKKRKVLELTINLPFFYGEEVRGMVERVCKKLGIGEKDTYALKNAVDEVYTNVFEHAYGGKPGKVVIQVYKEAKKITVSVRDWGKSYSFSSQKTVNLKEKVGKGETRGLGLSLTHRLVDGFSYKREGRVNEHIIVKEYEEE